VEAVGVAGGTLDFWLKMASNYPSLLSRTGVERWQCEPEPEPYRVLGARCLQANLVVILINCLEGLAAAKGVVRYGRRA
jgi:hypothetical protein